MQESTEAKASDLTLFAANKLANLKFNNADLKLSGLASLGLEAGKQTVDIASVLLDTKTSAKTFTKLDLSKWRDASLAISTEIAGDADSDAIKTAAGAKWLGKLALTFTHKDITWGKKTTAWQEAENDVYRGDSVTFNAKAAKTVKVTGSVNPDSIAVTGGTHTLKSGKKASISTDTLNVTGSKTKATFKPAVTINAALNVGKKATAAFGTLTTAYGSKSTVSGMLTATTLNNRGSVSVAKGGKATVKTADNAGSIVVAKGGTAVFDTLTGAKVTGKGKIFITNNDHDEYNISDGGSLKIVNAHYDTVNLSDGTIVINNITGSDFTVSGGTLTFENGSGIMDTLTMNDGTLKIGALDSYAVSRNFTAGSGSTTIVPVGNGTAIGGAGKAEAQIQDGARLVISGVEAGSNYIMNVLGNFKCITDANAAWKNNLSIVGASKDEYDIDLALDENGENYVLTIVSDVSKENKTATAMSLLSTEADNDEVGITAANGTVGRPANTDTFHIAAMAQSAVSAATDDRLFALAPITDPRSRNELWATAWRENGRTHDEHGNLDRKTKAYGVVFGTDRTNTTGDTSLGFAAHIGKGDTTGMGAFDGADTGSDFWGFSLYGRKDTGKVLFTGDLGATWYYSDHTAANGATRNNAHSTLLSLGGRAYLKISDGDHPGKAKIMPFIGLRWNHFRQSEYVYSNGTTNEAWTADQLLMPVGVRIVWNDVKTRRGTSKTWLEAGYQRAFGDTEVKTATYSSGATPVRAKSVLSDKNSFIAQLHHEQSWKNVTLGLNAGVRAGSRNKNYGVGVTLKWDL